MQFMAGVFFRGTGVLRMGFEHACWTEVRVQAAQEHLSKIMFGVCWTVAAPHCAAGVK